MSDVAGFSSFALAACEMDCPHLLAELLQPIASTVIEHIYLKAWIIKLQCCQDGFGHHLRPLVVGGNQHINARDCICPMLLVAQAQIGFGTIGFATPIREPCDGDEELQAKELKPATSIML